MIEFKLVLHSEHGGFSLTEEIVRRLKDRGSELVRELPQSGPCNYHPRANNVDFRRHPDLVQVVEELREELDRLPEGTSWQEGAALERQYLKGLKVVTARVEIDILDEDGRESLHVYGFGY